MGGAVSSSGPTELAARTAAAEPSARSSPGQGRSDGPSGSGTPLLEVEDLKVRFYQRGRTVRAVDGVSYTLEPGKTIAIIGESGSGKTVSSRAIIGLLPETARISGSAKFQGIELLGLGERALRKRRGPDFAMVFQDPARSLNPTMRIGSQITESIRAHLPVTRAQARERAIELLQMVRLPSPRTRFHEYPHQLSGGMRQRVMIAIALACRPKLLIADEATTALDVTTQAEIMDLLQDLKDELNMALILISHDLGLAASFTDEVMVMYAGRVVEQAPTRQLFAAVRMPYTKALLEAIPRLENLSHVRLPVVGGRPPDLTTLPRGCSFHPRCPYVQDDCQDEEPPLEEHEPGHRWACFHPVPVQGDVG
jgi:oligopeptide/dipeptide ABC transporter ATP-binding protein